MLTDNFFFALRLKKIFFFTPAGEIRKQYAAGLSFFTRKSKTRARVESLRRCKTRGWYSKYARAGMDRNDITERLRKQYAAGTCKFVGERSRSDTAGRKQYAAGTCKFVGESSESDTAGRKQYAAGTCKFVGESSKSDTTGQEIQE